MKDAAHYLGGNRCPYCNAQNDGATYAGPGVHPPSPDDVTVCLYCGKIGLFTETLGLRKPRPGELARIYAEDPLLARHVKKVKAAWEADNKRRDTKP